MDIQAYISSGIIENYVLGATTPEENVEVERLAGQHPEIQQEVEANQQTLLTYVLDFEQAPPAHLRNQVLDKLDRLAAEESTTEILDNLEKMNSDLTKEIDNLSKETSDWSIPGKSYLIAASFVLLFASFGANVYFYRHWQETKDNLRVALADKQLVAKELRIQTTRETEITEELALLKNPDMASVTLASVKGAPPCSAKIYWDTKTKYVYIDARQLPTPPKNKQYQLWYIDGKNTVDAGVFDMGAKSARLQKLKLVPNAQAFAVTLEKYGGVPKSEGDLYALGKMGNETREN